MIAFLFLVAAIWLGWKIVQKVPLILHPVEQAFFAIPVGLTFATWVSFGWGWACGLHWALPAGLMTCICMAVFMHFWKVPIRSAKEQITISHRTVLVWLAVTVLFFLLFYRLFSTHYLQPGSDGWYSGGDTWGDIALHLSLASFFAQQTHFTGDFSLFYGAKLTYPFLIDFLSSLLYRGGFTWSLALAVPSFLLCLSFVQTFFFLVWRWSRSVLAGALAVTFFLIGGSAGGTGAAFSDWQKSGISLGDFLSSLSVNYTHLDKQGMHFTNMIGSLLLTQRGLVLALALFICILYLAREIWIAEGLPSRRILGLLVILIAMLPWIHVHTFFVALFLLGGVGVRSITRFPKGRILWAWGCLLIIVIAAPQIVWQMMYAYHENFTSSKMGWMWNGDGSFISFLIRNFGVILPLFVASWVMVARSKERSFWVFLGAIAAALFIVSHLMIFQPNAWDNIKFLTYWYLIASILIAVLLARFRWLLPLGLLIVIPGCLSLLYEVEQSYVFTTASDQEKVERVMQQTPVDARILTGWEHNHPVNMLAGRPIVMGYPGWLWSYGINYSRTEQDIQSIYSGSSRAKELLANYDIKYVLISPWERRVVVINTTFWSSSTYPVTELGDGWQLYRITP